MRTVMPVKCDLVPHPVDVRAGEGFFRLDAACTIEISHEDGEASFAGRYLGERLSRATGFDLSARGNRKGGARIVLSRPPEADPRLGTEGYTLQVMPKRVDVQANGRGGFFYGCQTLLQLLPPDIESASPVPDVDWSIPCVRISDHPRFAWRGLMLDVVRHFFTKEEVMAYIDQMSKYKLNVLHLHLTDDQGWRLDIKRLPRLTAVGAWRVPRTGEWWSFGPPQPGETPTYGGFYTQDDVREIVDFAKTRCITVVPEIDVPGHSLAALAAYPELSCTGGPFDVNPGSPFQGKIANTLCVGNDAVFEFLDDVITEVADLFPGEYLHMGGDEATKIWWKACPRCQKRMAEVKLNDEEELQSYLVRRVEEIIESKGKRLVGWDEILEGGLAPNATVMSWRGTSGGITAASMGHSVVMTPEPYYYLDFYQGDPTGEPCTYSMSRLRTCYEFEPVPEGVRPELILGGQGNLWTESVPDIRHAQYMTWPRSLAIAETLWSPAEAKEWESFSARVEGQLPRFDIAQVKYARSMYDPAIRSRHDDRGELLVELETEMTDLEIHYTWAGTNPDQFSLRYESPLTVPRGASELRVITCRGGSPIGKEMRIEVAEVQRRAGDRGS